MKIKEYTLRIWWELIRDTFATLLILTILIGGYLLTYLQTYRPQKGAFWNPYIFCGMPSIAVGSNGIDWHNMFYNIWNALIFYTFHNPIMFFLFMGLSYWLYIRYMGFKPVLLSYISLILVEIFMVLTTGLGK